MDLHETVIPELKKAQESVQWVAVRLDGLTPGNGKRNVLAGALYDVAIEHRVGIVASLSAGAVASAFALVRVQFEALLRGGWVHRAATDDQVQAFFDGKDPPRLNDLVDAIEQHQDFGHGLLVSCPADTYAKSVELLEDGVGGGRPLEWLAVGVV